MQVALASAEQPPTKKWPFRRELERPFFVPVDRRYWLIDAAFVLSCVTASGAFFFSDSIPASLAAALL